MVTIGTCLKYPSRSVLSKVDPSVGKAPNEFLGNITVVGVFERRIHVSTLNLHCVLRLKFNLHMSLFGLDGGYRGYMDIVSTYPLCVMMPLYPTILNC